MVEKNNAKHRYFLRPSLRRFFLSSAIIEPQSGRDLTPSGIAVTAKHVLRAARLLSVSIFFVINKKPTQRNDLLTPGKWGLQTGEFDSIVKANE